MKRGRDDSDDSEEMDEEEPPKKKQKLDIAKLKEQYSLNDAKCKFCSKRPVARGRTKRGNPYDTCCRDCAVSKGKTPYHSFDCNKQFYGMYFLLHHANIFIEYYM